MIENYLNVLKRSTLFSHSNPVPFYGQNYKNQKGPGTSHQSIFKLQKIFRKIPFSLIYHLTKNQSINFWLIRLRIYGVNKNLFSGQYLIGSDSYLGPEIFVRFAIFGFPKGSRSYTESLRSGPYGVNKTLFLVPNV